MFRRTSILITLVLVLAGISVGAASAAGMPSLDLPPGIAAQAQPHLEAMMMRMQQSGMSHEQQHMMMQDMQTIVDQLPPGIFLQILTLMPELDMDDMMDLHQRFVMGDLLQQPPGQILSIVKSLAN